MTTAFESIRSETARALYRSLVSLFERFGFGTCAKLEERFFADSTGNPTSHKVVAMQSKTVQDESGREHPRTLIQLEDELTEEYGTSSWATQFVDEAVARRAQELDAQVEAAWTEEVESIAGQHYGDALVGAASHGRVLSETERSALNGPQLLTLASRGIVLDGSERARLSPDELMQYASWRYGLEQTDRNRLSRDQLRILECWKRELSEKDYDRLRTPRSE